MVFSFKTKLSNKTQLWVMIQNYRKWIVILCFATGEVQDGRSSESPVNRTLRTGEPSTNTQQSRTNSLHQIRNQSKIAQDFTGNRKKQLTNRSKKAATIQKGSGVWKWGERCKSAPACINDVTAIQAALIAAESSPYESIEGSSTRSTSSVIPGAWESCPTTYDLSDSIMISSLSEFQV